MNEDILDAPNEEQSSLPNPDYKYLGALRLLLAAYLFYRMSHMLYLKYPDDLSAQFGDSKIIVFIVLSLYFLFFYYQITQGIQEWKTQAGLFDKRRFRFIAIFISLLLIYSYCRHLLVLNWQDITFQFALFILQIAGVIIITLADIRYIYLLANKRKE